MSQRIFLCVAAVMFGLAGHMSYAQQAQFQRTELEKIDLPGTQFSVVLMLVDIPAGFTVDRHTHPGVEAGYIMQGEADFMVDGQPDRHVKTGDHFTIAGNAHSVHATQPTKVLVTYVVDKSKPLASPAPK